MTVLTGETGAGKSILIDALSLVVGERGNSTLIRDKEKRAEMMQRSNGGRTVPQVFINNIHVGGCDELYDLENMGHLDKLLLA